MKKRNNKDNFAIYSFSYYKKDSAFPYTFCAKVFLSFITCFCGAYYFSEMLNMRENAFGAAMTAGIACVFYITMFGLFGRWKIVLMSLAALIFSAKKIPEWGLDFFKHILRTADGTIVDTDKIIKADEAQIDPFPFLLFLCAVFGLLFALSCCRRFTPGAVLTYFVVMLTPSFLSQNTCYHPSLGIFIAGIIALWSASAAFYSDFYIKTGENVNLSFIDKRYRKNIKKASPSKRIKSDNLYYNKHLSDTVVILISTALIISVTAACFPEDGDLRFERITKKVSETVKELGEQGAYFFRGMARSPYRGFFSADGGSINISNGINPNKASHSDSPVLEVLTENKDKLYLRGDIGYEFDGNGWSSISDINFDDISYYVSADEETHGGHYVSVSEVLSDYTPETEYLLTARESEREYGLDKAFINTQRVKISYLQKLNTVFFAGVPLIYTFRESDNFSVKGDFIALADKGKINSMETLILYPVSEPSEMFIEGEEKPDFREFPEDDFSELSVNENEYKENLKLYENFVYDYYTSVPDKENRTIVNAVARLLNELSEQDDKPFSDIADNAGNDMHSRAVLADCIRDYFISGDFSYSLTADNFSSGDSPLNTFLFETKAGHCAMYASSMCLMLRHFGVPARYVTGFTVGGENYIQTADGYKYTVLQKNLHSWVEVYFDDIGWFPYDPTPGGGMSVYSPVRESEETTTAQTETVTETPSPETTDISAEVSENTPSSKENETATSPNEPDDPFSTENQSDTLNHDFLNLSVYIIGIPLSLFLVGMTAAGIIRSLNKKQNQKMKFFRSGEPKKAVQEMLEFSLRLLELNGIYRQNGETPDEFAFRADKTLKAGNIFRDAVPLYERATFCAEPEFTKEEQLSVFESVSKLLKITLDGLSTLKRFSVRLNLFGRKTTQKRIKKLRKAKR